MPVPFTFALASGAVPASELDSDFADLEAKIQTSSTVVGTAAGTANAITAAFTPTVTSLAAGLTFLVRAASANTSASPTFKADGTTAKTIVKGTNKALVPGDIPGAGFWMELTYDLTLDKYVLDNPATPAAAFSFPLGVATASNAATLDFTGIPSGLIAVEFIVEALCVTGGSSIGVRASHSGTFNTGANYTFVFMENTVTSPGTFTGGGGASNSIGLALNVSSNASLSPLNFTLRLIQGGGLNPGVHGQGWYIDNSSVMHARTLSGVINIGEIDGLRLFTSAGNITGTIYAWGIVSP